MSDNKITEMTEQNRKNIELIAAELDARVESSPEAEREKAAFFTGKVQETNKSENLKTFETMERNAENIVRLCKEVGILDHKINGEATSALESDEAKSLFGVGE